MKTLSVLVLLLVGACHRSSPRDLVPEYKKPFSEIRKEKEAYVDAQVKKYGPAVLTDEAGAYREYMRWLRFWGPRIGPNGTYQSYNKNLKDYYDAQLKADQSKTPSLSAPGNMDNWKELGPFVTPTGGIPSIGFNGGQLGVGIIQSVVINRQNSNKLLGNSLAGGLFFSDDKGVNWSNAGSDAWFRSGCATAAFAPDNETTWYAGSNSGGTYYRNSIGSVGGVYRTTNAGLSWDIIADCATFNPKPLDGESTVIHRILIDPKHSNIGYLGTNIGLYQSTNINALSPGSVGWSLVHIGAIPGIEFIEDIEFTTDTSAISTLLVSYSNGGAWNIAKSTDQGTTWSLLPASGPSQPSYLGTTQVVLEVTDAASNLLYVLNRKALAEFWVFNLTPGTWNTPPTPLANAVGQGHAFGVSNFNANIVYVGQTYFLYKSTNGGSSFTQITPSLYHNDVEDIVTPHASCAGCSQEVYVSTHGGVNYSPDQMLTLQSRSRGLGLASINMGSGSQGNPERIAIGVDHDGSMLSHGSYAINWIPAWDTVYDGDGGQALIDYSDGNNVWVERQQAVHQFSSTGGGAGTYTSTAFALSNDFYSMIAQNQVRPEVVYSKSKTNAASGLFEDLFRSEARGLAPIERISDFKTTHSLAPGLFIFGMYLSPSDPDVMYVTQDQNGPPWKSRLFRNTMMTAVDSVVKANWVELQFPQGSHGGGPAAVDLTNPNIVYFSYAGSTWQYAEFYKADYTPTLPAPTFTNFAGTLGSGGLPNTRVAGIVLEKGSNGGIYTATDIGIFYTNNSMINSSASQWIRLGVGLPNVPLSAMDINYTANKIRAYTHGRGVWEHDLACPSDLSFNFTGTQATNAFYEAVDQITSTATVSSSNSITYRAGTYVQMNAGFVATPDNSNYFYAFVHPCNHIGSSP